MAGNENGFTISGTPEGTYIKIGKQVHVEWSATFSAVGNDVGQSFPRQTAFTLPFAGGNGLGIGRESSSVGCIYMALVTSNRIIVNPYEGAISGSEIPFEINTLYYFSATYVSP